MTPDETDDDGATTTEHDRLVTAVVGRRALHGGLDAVVLCAVALGVFLIADRGYDWIRGSYPDRLAPGQAEQIWFLLDVVDAVQTWFTAILAVWALLYLAVVPWLLRGRTPGMLATRLRVATRAGERPTIVAHLVRTLGLAVEIGVPAYLLSFVLDAGVAACAALLVPFALIATTREHTRLGDVIARTRVVWSPPAS